MSRKLMQLALPADDLNVLLDILNDNTEHMTSDQKAFCSEFASNIHYDFDEAAFNRQLKMEELQFKAEELRQQIAKLRSELSQEELQELAGMKAARP